MDVTKDAFYYEPVLWAVTNEITTGTSPITFSPDAPCTRAQVVTFLWRAEGKPEPKTADNPFYDVRESDYFYKAVLWAVEEGITKGTSDTSFSPDMPCTRAHVATFLWRSKGEPASGSGGNPFYDVPAEQYYYKAVLWAVENDVTKGIGTGIFAPDNPCTRGQIVTFQYRASKITK